MDTQEYVESLSDTRKSLYQAGMYPTLHGAQVAPRAKKSIKKDLLRMIDKLCAVDLLSLQVICFGLEEKPAPKVRARKGGQ
jgi:hypothetical protein